MPQTLLSATENGKCSESLQIVKNATVLEREFNIYGTVENPLFLAKDVAEWIEYSKTSEGFYQVSNMLKSVDDDEKITINILNSEGNAHNQWFLTENGLYEVLMLSRKPIAKEFKKQVKHILKEIRVNGGYIAGQEKMTDSEIIAQALVVANNVLAERDKRIKEQSLIIRKQENKIAEDKPKVDFFLEYADAEGHFFIGELGKKTGFGDKKIFPLLVAQGFIHKVNKKFYYKLNRENKIFNADHYVANYGYEKYFFLKSNYKEQITDNGIRKFATETLMLNQDGWCYFLLKFTKKASKTNSDRVQAAKQKYKDGCPSDVGPLFEEYGMEELEKAIEK